jgi:hypothetical protein
MLGSDKNRERKARFDQGNGHEMVEEQIESKNKMKTEIGRSKNVLDSENRHTVETGMCVLASQKSLYIGE